MENVYAAPESDLREQNSAHRTGGSVEDAIAGNIEIGMISTMGEAWRNLKGFKFRCLVAFFLYFIIAIFANFISTPIIFGLIAVGADQATAAVIGGLIQMITSIVIMPMIIGIHIMGMRHAENKSVSPGSIFNYFARVPAVFLCYLIMTIMIMLGLILLILPGIYLMVAYMFSMPLVVEKNMPAWQALEVSRKALTRKWFPIFGLLLLMGFINTLAIFTLGIAWIWTIPWSVLTMSMVYTKLFGAEPHTLAD
ncbi:MAG: hypothetical protein O7F15_02640 [Gammaproteobacteria bacterium]|nr:hypothetical protein [Gammaproteobacteria bacterium]